MPMILFMFLWTIYSMYLTIKYVEWAHLCLFYKITLNWISWPKQRAQSLSAIKRTRIKSYKKYKSQQMKNICGGGVFNFPLTISASRAFKLKNIFLNSYFYHLNRNWWSIKVVKQLYSMNKTRKIKFVFLSIEYNKVLYKIRWIAATCLCLSAKRFYRAATCLCSSAERLYNHNTTKLSLYQI